MRNLFTLISFLIYPFLLISQDCSNFWVQVSPDGNHIYFSSSRDGDFDIYKSDINGVSNVVKLVDLPGDDLYPSLNADGTMLVFQNGNNNKNAEVFTIYTDGTGLKRLTANRVFDGQPSFSPDCETIVFSAWDEQSFPEIFTMDLQGRNRTQITNTKGSIWHYHPQFAPNGKYIYFLEGRNANEHIVRMDLRGNNWKNITKPNEEGHSDGNFFFDPEGKKIIYSTHTYNGQSNGNDLVISEIDGSKSQTITSALNDELYYQACFHPSLDFIYYTHISLDGVSNIYRMRTDGTQKEVITNCQDVSSLDWNRTANLEVYPFTVESEMLIRMPEGINGNIELKIYDAIGQLVLVKSLRSDGQMIPLNVNELSNGIFTISVSAKDGDQIGSNTFIKTDNISI